MTAWAHMTSAASAMALVQSMLAGVRTPLKDSAIVTGMWKTSAESVEGMDTLDVQTPVPATTTAGLVGKTVLVSIKRAQGAQTRRRATTMPRHPSKTALVSNSMSAGYAVATAFLKAIVTVRAMSLTAVEYARGTILLVRGAPTKWRATTTPKPSF